MNLFDMEFDALIEVERGHVKNENDLGGETRWGVTEKKAREHGYTGDMKDLPIALAKQIAKKDFWDVLMLDDIALISPKVAHEMFDTSYNMGDHWAALFLQTCLNVFNRQKKDYPDISMDGKVGVQTVNALSAYMLKRAKDGGEIVLCRALNSMQGDRFIDISLKREKNEEFTFGWFKHRVMI